MDATVLNLKRTVGYFLLALFVPGGSLAVLAILCAERVWKRHRRGDTSPLSTIQRAERNLDMSP